MEKTLMEKYAEWMEFCEMKYTPQTWIGFSIIACGLIGVLSFVLSSVFIQGITLIPLAFSISALVLTLGYPYMKKESIINEIEKNFSDALKQMADTLKAGDTYENALREVVDAEYGKLSKEMNLALTRMEDGENLDSALNGFSARVDSRLIKRTITIILDSIKTGASLAEILDDIADDVRDIYRLKEDRKASTTMQFMFLIAAGGFIAPMIFGEITSVISSFGSISTRELNAVSQADNFTPLIIQIYLIVEVIGSGAMMALIREGKLNKSIIYIPVILLVAFLCYHGTNIVVRNMIMGSL
jgi:archaellum biogenesis protein FlaJ (TadC family)